MTRQAIRVGIIGTGRISDLHAIEYIQNPFSQISALCDQDLDLATARAKKWGCPDAAVTNNYEDLLARDDVDLVELLLPHNMPLPIALKAIEAKKIISLQKPMCINLDEADQLVAAAEASPHPFKVFENFIFYPPVMKAKALIDEGAIGEPLSIRIKSNSGKGKTAWEIPRSADAWRQDKETSGGGPLVFDDGHHKFALAWYFMGNPEEVHSYIHHTQRKDGGFLDAPSLISFRFQNGKIGNLEVVYSPELEISGYYYAQDDRVEITGTHGIIWINGGHGRIGETPPLVLYSKNKVTEYQDIATGWEQSFIQSTRHFLNVLKDGGEPILTARQGRQVLKFALAAEESAQKGQSIRLQEELK